MFTTVQYMLLVSTLMEANALTFFPEIKFWLSDLSNQTNLWTFPCAETMQGMICYHR